MRRFILGLFFLCACSSSGAGELGSGTGICRNSTDCLIGQTCDDGMCVSFDGGVQTDSQTTCSAATCGENGSICLEGSCCEQSDVCGQECCGDGQACELGRCIRECAAEETLCGDARMGECCTSAQVCYFSECISPGVDCESDRVCGSNEYCEPTLKKCLPKAETAVCEYRPPAEALEYDIEWHWSRDPVVYPGHDQVMMTPVVANLTDDNGDGKIDTDDVPDVVFTTFNGSYTTNGVLRVISGDDGSRIWPTNEGPMRFLPNSQIALGDVDTASLGPEIVACEWPRNGTPSRGHLVVLSGRGELLHQHPGISCHGGDAPSIVDGDGDGVGDILIRDSVVKADGTLIRYFEEKYRAATPIIIDIDRDGQQELVFGDGVVNMDGSVQWEHSEYLFRRFAVADLDLDGDAEIVGIDVAGHAISAVDGTTGELIWGPININPAELKAKIDANVEQHGEKARSGGGPVTIANFDDDPEPEIAFAGGYAYVVFEGDGTRKWWFETQDRSSRATGSSVFDFNGDGVAEVLYNDELKFRIFDGKTGDVQFERCNTSGTLIENPVVVDVDNDDHAEIILMANNYSFNTCEDGSPSKTGVFAFGHPRNQWVRTRRIWNQHAYHVTNINEDGTVPVNPALNWTSENLNNYRQNVQPEGLLAAPDLRLQDLRVDHSTCPSSLALSVRVVNQGSAGAPAGVNVSVFEEREDGTRTIIGQVQTTRRLLPGESELLVLSPGRPLIADELDKIMNFVAAIADDDGLNECDVTNNESEVVEGLCTTIG